MTTATQVDPELTAALKDHYEKLKAARFVYRTFISEAKAKKAELKAAVEAEQRAIEEIIEEMQTGGPELFRRNGAKGPPVIIEAQLAHDLTVTEPQAKPAVEDTSWRGVQLGAALMRLPAAILKTLIDAGLFTVGDLQDFIAAKAAAGWNDPITQIKGIGPAKAEKIAEALEAFWNGRKAAQ